MLPAGTGYTTLEFKISFIRGMTKDTGAVRTEGRTLNVGRRAATAEARITDAKGRLLAHATTTCLVFEIPEEDVAGGGHGANSAFAHLAMLRKCGEDWMLSVETANPAQAAGPRGCKAHREPRTSCRRLPRLSPSFDFSFENSCHSAKRPPIRPA